MLRLDVAIPVYNAAATLEAATMSALQQPQVDTVWLVDDASTDNSLAVMQRLQQQHAERVRIIALPQNGGVSVARNQALWRSQAECIAFLDADDAYLPGALEAPWVALSQQPMLGLVRLGLLAQGFPTHFMQHPGFARAWQSLEMTVGGNTVFRRAVLLACGGFPEDALFRRLGGEDAALGIALTRASVVGTLFAEKTVVHNYRPGMHAERLLNAHLGLLSSAPASAEDLAAAEAVTQRIVQQLAAVRASLDVAQTGICPLHITRGEA